MKTNILNRIICVIIAAVIILFSAKALTDSFFTSDSEILESMFVKSVTEIVSEASLSDSSNVKIYYKDFFPSEKTRRNMESAITAAGLALTDKTSSADIQMNIFMTEAFITIEKFDDIYERKAFMDIHANFVNKTGKVIFCGKSEKKAEDRFNKKVLKYTEDSYLFGSGTKKFNIERTHNRWRVFSFITVIAALSYYSSDY